MLFRSVLLLFVGVVFSQDICGDLTANSIPTTGRPKLREVQHVLYVNVLPGYEADMKKGFDLLQSTLASYYPGSTAEFWALYPTSPAVGSLDKYTQIWVADLGYNADNSASQMATYRAIANWYNAKDQPHIICDGRYISELWYPSAAKPYRPSQKLVENYFVNLAVRGGGLMLATDHAEDFTRGINEINKLIQIGPFHGYYATPPLLLEVDVGNPLMKYPNDPSHDQAGGKSYLYDDSSTSFTPYNIQPNGKILYPIGWHGAKGSNNPGISTTIRGQTGFLVQITSPLCGARFPSGTNIQFTGKVLKGGTGALTWRWTSSLLQTPFGSQDSFIFQASAGQHIVTVSVKDSTGLVAEDTVSFRVVYDATTENNGLGPNGDGTCYILKTPKDVVEIFPLTRVETAEKYYNYVLGDGKPVDVPTQRGKAASFYLYNSGTTLSFTAVMSKLSLTGSVQLDMKSSGLGTLTSLKLKDDPKDTIVWYPSNATGMASWTWKGTTKGFVISGFPNQRALKNIWCVDVAISKLSNLEYLYDFSHALPSSQVPNPSAVVDSQWYILGLSSISYCRTTCYVPKDVTLTGLQGTFAPQRVNWEEKNGGDTYHDNYPTTWRIKPAAAGVAGIGVHFTNVGIAASDALKVFAGDSTTSVPALSILSGASSPPAPVNVSASTSVVSWIPNNDKVSGTGWTAWYVVIPSPTSLSPINGPESSFNWVTINGTNFVNTGKNVVRFGSVLISGSSILFDSPTGIRVLVPPSNKPMTVDVDVSNDGVFFQKLPQKYTFFQGTCKDTKSCSDCFNLAGCTWCTDQTNDAKSFCFLSSTTACPVDGSHHTQSTCSNAPDRNVTVQEGKSVQVTLVKPSLLGKVTQIKISGVYNGTIMNMTGGFVTPNAKGEVTFVSNVYLNGKPNQEGFSYELSGPGIKDTGRVTVSVTPVDRKVLEGLWTKDRADECKDGTHNCQQLCLDGTPLGSGTYICGCNPGYTLDRKRFCLDIDECALPENGCQFGCVNLPGTYKCKCQVGSALVNGACKPLDCPIGNWTVVSHSNKSALSSMKADLPLFVGNLTAHNPSSQLEMVAGYNCDSCQTEIIQHRTIDHTKWNGSPKCAADAIAVSSDYTCGYPCKNEQLYNGMQAVSYTMVELDKNEWLASALSAALGSVALFVEAPVDVKGQDWAMNYFRVIFASCDDASLATASTLIHSIVSDILPIFARSGRISVTRENVNKYPCGLKVTIDDLVPSLDDCKDPDAVDIPTLDYSDGLSSGEIAAIIIGCVIIASVVVFGAVAAFGGSEAAAAPYVAV